MVARCKTVCAGARYLASHTILETLLYINDDEKVAFEGALYYRLAHFSDPGDWAGPDLVSDWFGAALPQK